MLSPDIPRMPDPVERDSFIPTLDRQGAVWLYVDPITQAYLDFAASSHGTLLEIAAGSGHIVIKVSRRAAATSTPTKSIPGSWPSSVRGCLPLTPIS